MTTIIKVKTNIDKHRVAANITESHMISKSIYNAKDVSKKCQKSTCFIWTYGPFSTDYRVATASTVYLTMLLCQESLYRSRTR